MSESEQLPRTTGEAKELANSAAKELLARAGADSFDALVVLGSGWAGAADTLGTPDIEFDATELPGFVAPTAEGHSGRVRSTWVGDKRVVVFMGRVHLYEGPDPMVVTHAVRTGIAAGARVAVLTGSAGSLRTDYRPGQPVVLRDHVNLTARSPLTGPDFVDLTEAYSERLRGIIHEVDASLAEGVYVATSGPQLQTPAELKILRQAGADVVGRSIALEAIASVEMGAEVLGLSVVSNDAVGAVLEPFESERALEIVTQRARRLGELLHRTLAAA
ncbi:purine nucleoside phosphorylase [Nocardiopsis terrae]|uniref:Purine nucleoside phosphorylase n=1 Tax=Nocardiopsis terrae TaxID=372655 RepID=A0ABR9HBM2_9ACTN|nr:purine-nucleoside phosphorylase [Nocardiopsis terrae]MBE1456415.1 purine-nucleoside phosphorylase [Nocardiopsis terrae]GHC76971.1 purine nucleoside phosphorylase [Nocardiopsis terrae]